VYATGTGGLANDGGVGPEPSQSAGLVGSAAAAAGSEAALAGSAAGGAEPEPEALLPDCHLAA
jgi:hypothetical protein